jgi:hypothetical protein
MTFNEFQNHLIQALSGGTLLIPKHDPNNLNVTWPKYRTVLSNKLADDLNNFIISGIYDVIEFDNKLSPNSPLYFVLTPKPESGFSISASGVPANSTIASSGIDKLIAVSGQHLGWHLFGEDESVINIKINNGDLISKGSLT